MSRLTTDRDGPVEVMAAYLPEPERATVDDDGVVRDAQGSAFSTDSYWIASYDVEDEGGDR